MVRLTALVLFVVAACGNIHRKDAGSEMPVSDAAMPHEARELVSGGARMTSATYTFDVQVGHAIQQGKAAGPTYRFEARPAVTP